MQNRAARAVATVRLENINHTELLQDLDRLNTEQLIPGVPKKVHKFEIKNLRSENRLISKIGVTC